ncbi:hypothetical protein GGE67_001972 [Rhizobium leucaenae]|uniref:Uncharacterized protein n=1 Tax=Rhizobium leucaenae TaxID=29450 RepID=A0A7W6ZR59_9HYPH|nr:hypothetical protein [Rhizobium leucaenae]MBB6301363.1 hypothetical protein [Rhizobium leucaenae]
MGAYNTVKNAVRLVRPLSTVAHRNATMTPLLQQIPLRFESTLALFCDRCDSENRPAPSVSESLRADIQVGLGHRPDAILPTFPFF